MDKQKELERYRRYRLRNRKKYLERQRNRQKKRYANDKIYRLKRIEAARKQKLKNRKLEPKNKRKARKAVAYAIKHNQIKKPIKCQDCKKITRLEGHHHDYSQLLNVIWICHQCHIKYHK